MGNESRESCMSLMMTTEVGDWNTAEKAFSIHLYTEKHTALYLASDVVHSTNNTPRTIYSGAGWDSDL